MTLSEFVDHGQIHERRGTNSPPYRFLS
ncbi:uncharacterized protein METZ01_LOCUS469390, partial [marine metagenome]